MAEKPLKGIKFPGLPEIYEIPLVESEEHPGCYYGMVDGVKKWLNPPMEVGAYYLTTERYDGKAVRTVLLDGGLATDDKRITLGPTNNFAIVRHHGWLKGDANSTIPYDDIVTAVNPSGNTNVEWKASVQAVKNELRLKCSDTWASGNYHWYHQIWYVMEEVGA